MGSPAPEQEALLSQARAAHREHRYDVAFDALRSAQEQAPLDVEDLNRFADSAWWLGVMGECLRLTEQLHQEFLSSGRLDEAAAQALGLGSLLAMRGEPALAAGWLGRARRLFADQPPGPAHGMLWYTDLLQALEENRLDEVTSKAAELRRLGEGHDDQTLQALGFLGSGLAELRRGHVDDGFAQLDEAMLRVVGGGVDPEWVGHVYCTIVSACLDVADLNRARQWSDAAYRWLEDFSDAVMFTGVCRAHSVNLMVAEGAWAAAEAEAALVVRDLGEMNLEAVAEAEYQAGECHRLRGDRGRAESCYARAETLGRDPEPGRALVLLAGGDLAAAWTAVCDAVARGSANPFVCARLLRAQAEIGLAAGHPESATTAARRLRGIADDFATPGFRAWADHTDGTVALSQGIAALEDGRRELAGHRLVEAATCLVRAANGFRALRCWYDAAVVEAQLATTHRLLGNEDLARQHGDAAESGFRRLGVPTPSPPTAGEPVHAHDSRLTRREEEVLRQVATGLSNREVASVLTISEATVRRHLANVYRKLGVGSRTAAAAWAHEHGLVPRVRA